MDSTIDDDMARAGGTRTIALVDTLLREYAEDRGEARLANTEVQDILTKAIGIAEYLNHPELRVAHLFLAMTLTEEGRWRMSSETTLQASALRDACWRQMEKFFQLPKKGERVLLSSELKQLMDSAFAVARPRHIDNRALQVEDILRAILSPEVKAGFSELLEVEPAKAPAEQMVALAGQILSQIEKLHTKTTIEADETKTLVRHSIVLTTEVARAIGLGQPGLPTLSERTNQLLMIGGEHKSNLSEVGKALGQNEDAGVSLHQALGAHTKDSQANQSRTGKKVREVKSLLIGYLAAFGLLAVGAIAAAILKLT